MARRRRFHEKGGIRIFQMRNLHWTVVSVPSGFSLVIASSSQPVGLAWQAFLFRGRLRELVF